MTPEQIELARHALGLPNERRRSYRNHYVTGPGNDEYNNWRAMVASGEAHSRGPSPLYGGDYCFWLTPKGAAAALKPREKLDQETFPQEAP